MEYTAEASHRRVCAHAIYSGDEPAFDHVISAPLSCIGVDASVGKDAGKLDLVMRLLDDISTPEMQTELLCGNAIYNYRIYAQC